MSKFEKLHNKTNEHDQTSELSDSEEEKICNDYLDNDFLFDAHVLTCDSDINKGYNCECTTQDYINFLNGTQCTEYGKTYNDIMKYDHDDIEHDCRFIQWIFPLREKSAFAHNVPIIDLNELTNFINEDKTIVDKLVKSYNLMMNHWGLFDATTQKVKLLNGHNALRFSRMLQSLVYHKQIKLAQEAYKLISVHFGNCDENLNVLEPKIMISSDGSFVDAWEFHLLKAINEVNDNQKIM